MDALLKEQELSLHCLNRIVINLKKLGEGKITLGEINVRIDRLNAIWKAFESCHHNIMKLRDGTESALPYFEDDVYSSAEESFLSQMAQLLDYKEKLTARSAPPATASATPAPASPANIIVTPPHNPLPRINLPKFSGNYHEWRHFQDLSQSLIIDRSDLTNVQRFHYLKTSMMGEPYQLISNVTVSNTNFKQAWDTLKRRYDNKRILVNNLVTSLFEIRNMSHESISELRRVYNATTEALESLTSLGCPTDHWDILLVHMTLQRLDPVSHRDWELLNGREKEPSTFADIKTFIEGRMQALESLGPSDKTQTKNPNVKTIKSSDSLPNKSSNRSLSKASHSFHSSTSRSSPSSAKFSNTKKCSLCKGEHYILGCPDFRQKSLKERRDFVSNSRLCYNCLGNHQISDCKSDRRCVICNSEHNSFLHPEGGAHASSESTAGSSSSFNNTTFQAPTTKSVEAGPVVTRMAHAGTPRTILLATAQVEVISPSGQSVTVRALLDQGSEITFISEAVAQILQLSRTRVKVPLLGLSAASTGMAKYCSRISITSRVEPEFQVTGDVLILPKLTNSIPTTKIHDLDLAVLDGAPLADPNYNQLQGVGMILGADFYGRIMRDGLRSVPGSHVVAQNTAFGWALSGPASQNSTKLSSPFPHCSSFHCTTDTDLLQVVQRFWELEEVPPNTNTLTPEEEWCEQHFRETHSRDDQGRYVVRLPIKSSMPLVADETKRMATSSFKHLNRRFERDPTLHDQYSTFMTEYIQLGHMEQITGEKELPPSAWYLPHHPVFKSSGSGRKIRVVFDASRRSPSVPSLNDCLYPGPALQKDISLIVTNWRQHRIVFTADIVKMFRQILVHRDDQDFQRIVWSNSISETVSDFRLRTVTYGTTSAPFLALRTLLQLAEDECSLFPQGASLLRDQTFVDDIFSGADDVPSAIAARDELIQILESGGFKLDKWAANHPSLLSDSHRDALLEGNSYSFDLHEPVKTLGLVWVPSDDEFRFHVPLDFNSDEINSHVPTKRLILSTLARVFDPLGWISPVTVRAKIIMQDLWLLGIGWDKPLPLHIREDWDSYLKSLTDLDKIRIDRWTRLSPTVNSLELHGFADASTRAFAAAVYLGLVDHEGHVHISLVAAKSKVAPVKTVSLPRLELCSAVLLVKLLTHLRKMPMLAPLPITAWSDSQVALAWIKKHPSGWTTFVANRVAYIQNTLPNLTWNYVPTKENPSDMATRGKTPLTLTDSSLWWQGPTWLQGDSSLWPTQPEPEDTQLENRRPVAVNLVNLNSDNSFLDLISRFSSLDKLLRVTCYCLRFIKRGKYPQFITAEELRYAQLVLVKAVQASSFPEEIALLRANASIPRKSQLLQLNPFIDEMGILRVGGRLQHSHLDFNGKFPPILPKNSPLSQLFIARAHNQALHGGPSLTLGILLNSVWVMRAKTLVKSYIRSCIRCHKHKPSFGTQIMGNLPATRIVPERPFFRSGLDYAGPILLRMHSGRGQRTYKSYICLFVCFVTKALLLEVVSDATSQAFLAAFRRFCGRRGVPLELYSDNSTTFQGASSELAKTFRTSTEFYAEVSESLSQDGTSWLFIPPHAPHFGGLWEAGVRSVKHHLSRIIGDQILTYEELSTLLIQIEACLNSRPLYPMSADIDDLTVLTPAHFLIGSSLLTIPEPSLLDVRQNHLSRWQMLQQMYQHFWSRWSKEYLHHLQQRTKWRTPQENFRTGQLVLIKDDRYPPSKWALGRITQTHPGPDGHIRVVTVKTASSTLKRPIAKLSVLPIQQT